MSIGVAYVGDVIIKPEFRKDFGHFFRREYIMIEHDPLKKFVRGMMTHSSFSQFFKMSGWNHHDLLKWWVGRYKTCFDEESGEFTYGIENYSGPWEFFTELLPEITGRICEKESVKHDIIYTIMWDPMHNTHCAEVGQIIIKPEYRADFGHFFRDEYYLLQTELFKTFVEKHFDFPDYFHFEFWKHYNEEEEWRGKYETSYDEETGRFVYGFSCNAHIEYVEFFDIVEDMTETVISKDYWVEPM